MNAQKKTPMNAQKKKQIIMRIIILAVLIAATAALWIWLPGQYTNDHYRFLENIEFSHTLKIVINLKIVAYGLLTLTLIALFALLASLSKTFLKLGPIFAAVFGIVDAVAVFFYNNLLHMKSSNSMFAYNEDNYPPTPYSYFLRYDLTYRYGLSIFRYILLFVIVVLACLIICAVRSGWFRRLFHKTTDAKSDSTKVIAAALSVIILTATLSACSPKLTLDGFLDKYENTNIDILLTDSGKFLQDLFALTDGITNDDFKSWTKSGSMSGADLYYKETTLFGKPMRIDAYCYSNTARGNALCFRYELDNKTNMDIGIELCNRSIELLGPPDSIAVNTADPDSESTLDEYRSAVANGTAETITMVWSKIWIFIDESQVSWFVFRASQT